MDLFGAVRIGYLLVESERLDDWHRFAREGLGLHAERADTDTLVLRVDAHARRIVVHRGLAEDVAAIGLELDSEDTLREVRRRLGTRGLTPQAGRPEEAALRGVAGTVMHSQSINRMLTAKDSDGQALYRLLEQDDDNGVYTFEGLGRFYASDLCPVTYTVVSTGTTPPVLTLTGSPKGMYDQIRVECTTLGAFATAQIRISTDGGTTWVASGVVVPASGIVDRSDDLGLTFTFASGTFATNNVYTSRGKATSFMCKRGAAVFWHNNFGGGPEEQRDVLRKNSIVAADVLAVTHVYKRMSGGTRPGIAIAKYNI